MDYKSIRYALMVAEAGSFVRAAEKISLTQSAISRSVIALERELGVTLFDRSNNGAALTPAGDIFVQYARNIVDDMQSLKLRVEQHQSELSGEVVIGATPSLAVSHLPALIAESVSAYPKVCIRLEINMWNHLRESMRQGGIDFFIKTGLESIDDAEMTSVPVCSARGIGVFCRPGHALLQKSNVALSDLQHYSIVTGGWDKGMIKYYRRLLKVRADAPLNVPLVCENMMILQQVVTATDAVLITAPASVATFVEAGWLEEVAIDSPAESAQMEVELVTLKGRTLSPAALHLINRFQQIHAGPAPLAN